MTDPLASAAETLREAVRRLGSQAALARLVGVKQPSVWGWIDKGKALPAKHVLAVEAATGISRHDLRPDIYPRDPAAPAPAPAADPGAWGDMEPAR